MTSAYKYDLRDCQVSDKAALNTFRQKRAQWSDWLDDDPDHAIWREVSGLVWRETAFAAISKLALDQPDGPLNTTLIGETIISGHVATQVLALRRLTDRGKGVVSLDKLLRDVEGNWHLLTRENFVCFDGLPYDYEAVERETRAERGPGVFWGDTQGPRAWGMSALLHEHFDKLVGVGPLERSRSDLPRKGLIKTARSWLKASGAIEIAEWSHAYLAHAGMRNAREALAEFSLTGNKISEAIRNVARVVELVSGVILYIGGRSGAVMPVAQYDVFDRLDRPVATKPFRAAAQAVWNVKSDEWDACLNDVRDVLLAPP